MPPPTVAERIEATRQHLNHSLKWKGERLGIVEMRRHYTNYFRGLRGVKHYRSKLVTSMDIDYIFDVLDEIEQVYGNEQLAVVE